MGSRPRRALRPSLAPSLRPSVPPSVPPSRSPSRSPPDILSRCRPNLSFLNFLLISYPPAESRSSHLKGSSRGGHRNPHRCTDGMSSLIFRSTTAPRPEHPSLRSFSIPSRRFHLSSSIFAVYAISMLSGRRRKTFFRKQSCVYPHPLM